MLSTRNVTKSLSLAAGMLAIAGMARANTVTQTFTIPSQSVPFTQAYNYNLFDTSSGILTGVTLELVTQSTAEVDVFNFTATPQPFTNATATFPLTVSGPPGATTYITSSLVAGPVSATAAVGFNAYPGLTGTNDSGAVAVPSVDWNPNFEGPGGGPAIGQIIAAAGNGSYTGAATTGVFFGGSGVLGGTVTLVYTFQSAGSIPEPGTWALVIASASVSLAGLRRRRAVKG